jgi:hypothetical protein
MVKVQTSVLLKTALFWLNCNSVFGQNPFMNSGLTIDNKTAQNSECQTISDCSAGAVECRKDIMNESVSHCIYPDSLNDVLFNDIDVPVINHQSTVNDTTVELPNVGNTTTTTTTNTTATTTTCTKDEECPSNKCVSGQCQIDLNSSAVNGTMLNGNEFSHNNMLSLNCTTNEDCPSNKCVSGQCQTDLEQAALNICNTDQPGSICGGKLEGEKCEKDSECVTSYCNKKSNICAKKGDGRKNTLSTPATIIIVSTGFCIGFVLVLLLIKKDREEKAKKIREQYMENVQEPMYVIYSEDYDVPTYTY